MLETDVGDKMCWWQLEDVGDGLGQFCHQHLLSFQISVGHQNSKDVTTTEILSQTSIDFNQFKFINIAMSPTSLSLCHVADHKKQSVILLIYRLHRCWWLYLGDNDLSTRILILVTFFGCWCPTLMLKDRGYWWQKRQKPSSTSQSCRQHISSATSVTNIDVVNSSQQQHSHWKRKSQMG